MSFLAGKCLIAAPNISDERFANAVIFVCAHTKEGAMGLTINRPIRELTFPDLLSQLKIVPSTMIDAPPVLAGGPLDMVRGFVLHSAEYHGSATLPVGDCSALTVTTEVIQDIANGKGPQHFLVALGYAGWNAGQLDEEIKQNSWLTITPDEDFLFNVAPENKWKSSMRRLGIDDCNLSFFSGNA